MKPHTFRKVIVMSEDEWMPIYWAAKAAGLDPHEYIKRAAIKAAGACHFLTARK